MIPTIHEQAFYNRRVGARHSLLSMHEEARAVSEKKPSKADLSKAGKDLRNPRTPEKRETEAAKTLQKGRKKP